MSKTAIIIGGGLGGLFTGALLAKQDYKVTVLEKNATIGGGLQTFCRNGVQFETGMHILGGLREGGAINKICRYLCIMDKIDIRDVDHDCMDSITYLNDGKTYRIPEGRKAFAEYFAREFPAERDNIRRYVDKLYSIAAEVDFFYLRSGRDGLFAHSDEFLWPADEFIAHYISDERLRDILAYMNPMYGGKRGHTPTYIHALINVLYIDGPSRFAGGSQLMADALADVISSHGGVVSAGDAVEHIFVTEHNITSVQTRSGADYKEDVYISAIHPYALLEIIDERAFPKSYRSRLTEIPNTYSAFTLYIVFRPQSFHYINHTCYFQTDYGKAWDYDDYDQQTWPRGFMYTTPADKEQGAYATKMIVNCIMSFDDVHQWADTTVGHRGIDYEVWKAGRTERVLQRMEQLYPDFRASVQHVYASSPLTIRDYYNEKEGALYGFRKDCRNIVLSQVPIYTKVHNLYLTGQNINLHGICGVPLTAVNTVEAIIGENKIINEINKEYGKD